MISGMIRTERDEILNKMYSELDGNLVFHLTGSRFFKDVPITEYTDFDFFCQNSYEAQQFLRINGFEVLVAPEEVSYISQEICQVWRHPSGIDVQLVNNVDLKQKIQNILHNYQIFRKIPMSKRQKFLIWDSLFATALSRNS